MRTTGLLIHLVCLVSFANSSQGQSNDRNTSNVSAATYAATRDELADQEPVANLRWGDATYRPGVVEAEFKSAFSSYVKSFEPKSTNPPRGRNSFQATLRQISDKLEQSEWERFATRDVEALAYTKEYLLEWDDAASIADVALSRKDCSPDVAMAMARSCINIGNTNKAKEIAQGFDKRFGGKAVALGFLPVIAEKQMSAGDTLRSIATLQELVESVLQNPLAGDPAASSIAADAICRIWELAAIDKAVDAASVEAWMSGIQPVARKNLDACMQQYDAGAESDANSLVIISQTHDAYCCTLLADPDKHSQELSSLLNDAADNCSEHKWREPALNCELIRIGSRIARHHIANKNLLDRLVAIQKAYEDSAITTNNVSDSDRRLSYSSCAPDGLNGAIGELRVQLALKNITGKSASDALDLDEWTKGRKTEALDRLAVVVMSRIPEDWSASQAISAAEFLGDFSNIHFVLVSDSSRSDDKEYIHSLTMRMSTLHSRLGLKVTGQVVEREQLSLELPESHAIVLCLVNGNRVIEQAFTIPQVMRRSVPHFCETCSN